MSEQAAQEPTMEEILASIRRIISEDEQPAEGAAEAAPQPAPEPEPVHAPEPVAAAPEPDPSAFEEDDVLELTDRYEPAPAPVEAIGDIEAAPFERVSEDVPTAYDDAERLVRGRTADVAASAFSSFEQSVHAERGGKTIEALVTELLKPMLKDWVDTNMKATMQEWFDQNLTEIVDRQVREELERIARRRR
jgi:cell pole-organizing protein PopZ